MTARSYQVKLERVPESPRQDLTFPVMNSQMRRIDLICKLFGPFLIALVDGVSTEVAILVNLGMNLASILPEYLFIAQVSPAILYTDQPGTV